MKRKKSTPRANTKQEEGNLIVYQIDNTTALRKAFLLTFEYSDRTASPRSDTF